MSDTNGGTGPAGAAATDRFATAETSPLAVYLNDHLAGATMGLEHARRMARAHRGSGDGDVFERFSSEIAEDRTELLDIMSALGIPIAQYKIYFGWVAEKLGRIKFSGHQTALSPARLVIELEAMRLGVEGKKLCWLVLRGVADEDDRLDREKIDRLVSRARRQADDLEELRAGAAREAFGGRLSERGI